MNYKNIIIAILSISVIGLLILISFIPIFIIDIANTTSKLTNIYSYFKGADFSIFNNFITPIATIAAVIIYSRTLRQVKKQSENMNEQVQISNGNYYYKDFMSEIHKLEIKVNTFDYSIYLNQDFIKKEVGKINFSNISDSIEIIGKMSDGVFLNENYIRCINIGYTNVSSEDVSSFIEDFGKLNAFYSQLTFDIIAFDSLINDIQENQVLHQNQKKKLIEIIIKDLLSDFLIFMSKNENPKVPMIQEKPMSEIDENSFNDDFITIQKYYDWVKTYHNDLFNVIHTKHHNNKENISIIESYANSLSNINSHQ